MVLLVLLSGTSLGKASTPHQAMLPLDPKEWTFMVYLDGDCNLESIQISAFLMMAEVGSTADINVLVQFDRIAGYDARYGDWTDCKRFYITEGMTPTADSALSSLGEINMGNPSSLVDFIIWSVNTYPAEKYALVLSDHGDNGGICEDLTGVYDYLSCGELYEAMEMARESTGVKVDLIGLEACIMGAAEVAYHFSEGGEVMVASEEICFDWPYNDILSELTASPTMNSTALAQRIVHNYMLLHDDDPRRYERASLSALNLTRFTNELVSAINTLASRFNQTLTTYCYDILDAIGDTEYALAPADFAYAGDLYHFAQNIKNYIPDLQVQTAAQDVMGAIVDAQIAEWHDSGHPYYHGLSIFLPPTIGAYHSRMRAYTIDNPYWRENTTWDDFLYALFVTYAPGIWSRESLSDVSYTLFDSNSDDHLDAVHVRLDADTTGEALNVSVHGRLINSSSDIVDLDIAWTNASNKDEWCDLYLHVPSGIEEDWFDVELLLYDEYGIYEDYLFSEDAAYLPEEMHHDVAVTDVSILKGVVGQSFPAEVSVAVENKGHYPETFNVTTYANGTAINTTQIVIQSNSSTTFTICWNTTSQNKGTYTITSFAEPVEGEANTTDNNLAASSGLFITINGDVDGDRDVDIYDIVAIAAAYGSSEGSNKYDPPCDIDGNGKIDIYDVVIAAGNYEEDW
jgi:hypothetical protein